MSVDAVVCALCVPVSVQLPVPLVNVNPAVGGLGEHVNEIASVQVKVIVPIADPPAKVPTVPEAVTHTGLSETVRSALAVLIPNPLGFSTLR